MIARLSLLVILGLASCAHAPKDNGAELLKEAGGCPWCPECELPRKMAACAPLVRLVRSACVSSSSLQCKEACTQLLDLECVDCAQWDQQIVCERSGG